LGGLALGACGSPLAWLWAELADRGSPAARWLPHALALALLVLLVAGRVLTLPGAMAPRHEPEHLGLAAWRAPLVAALLAWRGHALFTRAFAPALVWLALGVVLERALARARRAAGGRALFLLAFAMSGNLAQASVAANFDLMGALGTAVALGCGAAYLVPWL